MTDDQRTATLAKRVDGLHARLDAITARLDRIETLIANQPKPSNEGATRTADGRLFLPGTGALGPPSDQPKPRQETT